MPTFDEEILTPTNKPTPTAPEKAGLKKPLWMEQAHYPLVHADHAEELDRAAGMNEFGKKLPRAQAEDEAYKEYVKSHREQAMAHHLAGMKAAHGAGDMEAARKHGLMYVLHAKALGHDPVGPAPDGVVALLKQPPKVYKFKAHHGDLFSVDPKADEKLDKTEALHTVWQACQVVLAKAVQEPPRQPGIRPTQGQVPDLVARAQAAADRAHAASGGQDHRAAAVAHLDAAEAYQHAAQQASPAHRPALDKQRAHHAASADFHAFKDQGAGIGEELGNWFYGADGLFDPVSLGNVASAAGQKLKYAFVQPVTTQPVKKAESPSHKAKASTCRCNSYRFPHRHKGGKCMAVDPVK